MSDSFKMSFEPTRDKLTLRRQLQAERLAMADRHERSVHLQEVLRVWLVSRSERSIGAYWPIKGEFDALPALFRWSEAEAALSKSFSADAIEGLTVSADGMISDMHGSSAYRAHLVKVMTKRAVAAAH